MNQGNFNLIAPVYDFLSMVVYGNKIRKAQIHFLDQIKSNSTVLILGGGTGWLLPELAKVNNDIVIDYVEASEKMLSKSKKHQRLSFRGINFILGTQEVVHGKVYDFVITPFVLDVFPQNEMESLALSVFGLIKPEGKWLCVDFNSLDRSIKARALSCVMIMFFRLVSGLKTKAVLDYFGTIKKLEMIECKTTYYYGQFIRATVFKKKSP